MKAKQTLRELRKRFALARTALANGIGLSRDGTRLRDAYIEATAFRRRALTSVSQRRIMEKFLRIYAYFPKRNVRREQRRLIGAVPVGINGRVKIGYYRAPMKWLE